VIQVTTVGRKKFSSDIWILDSGASNHFCRSMEGLTDVRDIDESIMIRNDDTMRATKVGNLKCEVTQLDGNKSIVSINEVKFVPNLYQCKDDEGWL
jgi:hypothetical protein